MAQQTFRLNLGSAEFPLLTRLYGRSIVMPQQDMHYIRPNAFSGAEADKNIGIPQMIFCENVMPTSYGYQSVGYLTPIQGSNFVDFDEAFYLRDAAENKTLFVPGELAGVMQRYTYDQTVHAWSANSRNVPAGSKCTVSNLKSRTFVHAEFDDEFWEWTGAWGAVVFTGLVPANIKGLVAANAYNIAYDFTTIYWSSTLDPTDFIPSLVTGAGSQRILSNKGRIVVCYPIEDGFVIHTTQNCIIAKYSQNSRFPWNLKEIKNSAGLANQNHATADGDNNNQYVYTANGLMSYGPIKADQIYAAVSEFLGERQLEVYDYNRKVFDIINTIDKFAIKITYIANRYLCISYGLGGVNADGTAAPLAYCLIYDGALKRWGKLRVTHMAVFTFSGNAGAAGSVASLTWAQLPGTWAQQNNTWFEYGSIISGGNASLSTPYRGLGFLQSNGAVKLVNFDWIEANDQSVMYIGRLQFLRNNLWTILDVEAESMNNETQTKMALLKSLDGLNYLPAIYPYKMPGGVGGSQKWQMRETAINHTLRFEGNFNLASIIARGKLAGSR